MEHREELVAQQFPERHYAGTLHAAGSAAGAGAAEAGQHQQEPYLEAPRHEVLGNVAGGGLYGNGLEHRGAQGLHRLAVVVEVERERAAQGYRGDAAQEQPQFLVLPDVAPAPLDEQQVEQREVDAADEHEGYCNPLDGGRLEMADACVVRREPARGDGRKGVAHGVKAVHARKEEARGAGYGKEQVDRPNPVGRSGNARM